MVGRNLPPPATAYWSVIILLDIVNVRRRHATNPSGVPKRMESTGWLWTGPTYVLSI